MIIKGILESLRDDVLNDKITIRQAAIELYRAGWCTFIDEEKAKRLLEKKQSQPTQANCTYVKNGSLYSIYDGRKIGKLSK